MASGRLDLKAAQESFLKLIDVVDVGSLQPFLDWVKDSFSTQYVGREPESSESDVILGEIVSDIRSVVPLECILPSENVVWPQSGAEFVCNPNITFHADGFLYDDGDLDDMCDNPTVPFSRHYCTSCGSRLVAPLTFISHSMSVKQLKFIFRDAFPSLNGQTVLDVGSRLGGVLYAAYLYSTAVKIIGVEMNADFCKIQQQIVDKYEMSQRIKIICDDVRNRGDELKCANVVVLHNVFQFFLPFEQQQQCWTFLRAHIQPSTILICAPSLHEMTQNMNFNVDDWVTHVSFDHLIKKYALFDEDAIEELTKIVIYQVK